MRLKFPGDMHCPSQHISLIFQHHFYNISLRYCPQLTRKMRIIFFLRIFAKHGLLWPYIPPRTCHVINKTTVHLKVALDPWHSSNISVLGHTWKLFNVTRVQTAGTSTSAMKLLFCTHSSNDRLAKMSYTSTEMKMSSFWLLNFHHWLHWKLSFWQLLWKCRQNDNIFGSVSSGTMEQF